MPDYDFNNDELAAIASLKAFCEIYYEVGNNNLEELDWYALSIGFFMRELGAVELSDGAIERAKLMATYVRYQEQYWIN